MNYWKWLRSCAHCSSYLPPIDLLCETCWTHLLNQRRPRRRGVFESQFEVCSLWDWQNNQDLIGQFIKWRKSPIFDEAHFRLSKIMMSHFPHLFESKTVVFPSKNRDEKDHTASLAQAWGQFLNISVVPIMIENVDSYKSQGVRQRLLKRKARQIENRGLHEPICFVDDVFTTGATAKAVWEAIGRPKQYTVSVLAYRAKMTTLATPSS